MAGKIVVSCLTVLLLIVTAHSYHIPLPDSVSSNPLEARDTNHEIYEVDILIEGKKKGNWYNWYNTDPPNEADPRCGTTDKEYKFFESTQSCYKVHTDRATWFDAEDTCSREGGTLAVINSRDEAQILAAQFPDGFRVVHVGFKFTQDFWMTLNGETLAEAGYTNWSVGEPNIITGKQYCGAMYPNAAFDGIDCSDKTAFICEITTNVQSDNQNSATETGTDFVTTEAGDASQENGSSDTESSSQSTTVEVDNKCSTDYEFYANTKSCYRFHSEKVSWDDAEATCVREGGHLAVVNSQDEAKYFATYFDDVLWLGIYKTEFSWTTVFNQTLTEAGYENWYGGASANDSEVTFESDSKVYCGVMIRSGELLMALCTHYETYFICEKDPKSQLLSTVTEVSTALTTTQKGDASQENGSSDTESSSQSTTVEVDNNCSTGYEFYENTKSCYRFHNEMVSWDDAEATCVREGGHLAVANSRDEAMYFTRYFDYMIWLGIYKTEFSWTTVYNQTLTEAGYENWYGGASTNDSKVTFRSGNKAYCGAMFDSGEFMKANCTLYKIRFFCEKDPNSQLPSTVTEVPTAFDATQKREASQENGSSEMESSSQSTTVEVDNKCSTDYEFYENTKSCYRFHSEKVSWDDAEATCVRQGGHLAVVNSRDEAMYLSRYVDDIIWLGIYKTEFSWTTVFNQTLMEAGYENWYDGAATNDSEVTFRSDNKEYCGSMLEDGKWLMGFCSLYEHSFICEKDPNYQLLSAVTEIPTTFDATQKGDASRENGSSDTASSSQSTTVEVDNKCPIDYEFFQNTKSCYKSHNEMVSWDDAEATCVREGGHLAVVTSQDEAKYLLRKIQNRSGFRSVWLGLCTQDTYFGKITTTEAENENLNRRRGIRGQHFGIMDSLYGGTIYCTNAFHNRLRFICEQESQQNTTIQTDTSTTETDSNSGSVGPIRVVSEPTSTANDKRRTCGTDSEYNYVASTRKCYKVHSERASWAGAEDTCVREGGHLAVINSLDEMKFFKTVFPQDSYQVFLGFHRKGDSWVTIEGQTLAEAGFDNWNIGEPNNVDGDQYCGSMYPDGTFDDIACNIDLKFICERSATIDHVEFTDVDRNKSSSETERLRYACQREREYRDSMAWVAKNFGDSRQYAVAQKFRTPSCEKLQSFQQ